MRAFLKPWQIEEIKRRYPDERAKDLADEFGVNIYRIYSVGKRYGIKKSEAFKNSPASGRIQKGDCLSPET